MCILTLYHTICKYQTLLYNGTSVSWSLKGPEKKNSTYRNFEWLREFTTLIKWSGLKKKIGHPETLKYQSLR